VKQLLWEFKSSPKKKFATMVRTVIIQIACYFIQSGPLHLAIACFVLRTNVLYILAKNQLLLIKLWRVLVTVGLYGAISSVIEHKLACKNRLRFQIWHRNAWKNGRLSIACTLKMSFWVIKMKHIIMMSNMTFNFQIIFWMMMRNWMIYTMIWLISMIITQWDK